MVNASIIGSNLLSFNLGSYHGRRNFDSKNFMTKVLGLKGQSPIVPYLEDLWQDCNHEHEVIRKDHSRLTLQQINALKLKFLLDGVIEDGSDIIELGWEETSEMKQLEVDWDQEEEDDINLRTRSILTHIDNWLRRRDIKAISEKKARKSSKKVSFSKTLTSDTPISSHVAGKPLSPNK